MTTHDETDNDFGYGLAVGLLISIPLWLLIFIGLGVVHF